MPTSPTPSAKDRVLAWVRSKNPASMELKFGCLFEFKSGFTTPSDGEQLPERFCNRPFVLLSHDIRNNSPVQTSDLRETSLVFCDEYGSSAVKLKVGTEIPMSFFQDNLKILGSDMGLAELLIAFYAVRGERMIFATVSTEGGLNITVADRKKGQSKHYVDFDLTKNLHQQPDEFYTALLPLFPDA